MMKASLFFTCFLSSALLMSCAQMKKEMKKTPSSEMADLMETVELEQEESRKTGEENHKLAEADADDISIKQEVGDSELDTELPGSESDKIPYSREFLINKKTKRMQFWVEYFTKKQRERFQRFINNGEEYRHHIEKIFAEYGLPKELYFVGLIESGYYLSARSHAAAVGPWQFMPGTGRQYGLRVTQELDERQDLFKASHAAAKYFKNLHNIFSSWELALSAYNAGEYGIIRRIMKHGTRDFYQLSRNKQLPSETINYVPKVLAAMHIVNNAKEYGFEIPNKKHRLFDNTELRAVGKGTPLKVIARKLGVSSLLLKKLNPELRRTNTPRRISGTYFIRVPQTRYAYSLGPVREEIVGNPNATVMKPETRRELARRIAHISPKTIDVSETEIETEEVNESVVKTRPNYHVVKRGETLFSIARKYETSPSALARVNNFRTWRVKVRRGQRLALSSDVVSVKRSSVSRVKTLSQPIVYKVRRGDNLTDLAKLFNLNVSKLKRANNLKRGQIMVGQRIVLPDTKKGIYVVKRGDHLTKVAKELNRPLDALVKLNSLKRKTIYPGQKLIVNMD